MRYAGHVSSHALAARRHFFDVLEARHAAVLNPFHYSFRILVVTDLLSQNVPLENIQYLDRHVHPRTTQLYDRRHRRVTRNIVERILF